MLEKKNLPILASENSLYQYLKTVNKIPSLTPEEEFMLAKAFLDEHDIAAAHQLVTSHLKLVAKIALSYRSYGVPTTELISEGNLGLMHAVKKFNPEMGNRLSTYAMWWIKAAIQEYLLRSWSLVKIGTTATQKKLFFNLGKIKNKIRNSKAREINDDDYHLIAENLGVSTAEVTDMDHRLSRADLSLNSPIVSSDRNSELIEFLPENRPSHELTLSNSQERNIRQRLLLEAMKQLNSRELLIMQERRLRDPAVTLDELSKKLNISKERVRQIENRAFEKVQNSILEKI